MAQPLDRSDPIQVEALARLARGSVSSSREIRSVLERVWREGIPLSRGLNRRVVPEIARLREMSDSGIVLAIEHFEQKSAPALTLNFLLDGELFRFQAEILESTSPHELRIAFPRVLLRAERRDRLRAIPPGTVEDGWRVIVRDDAGRAVHAIVRDAAPGGYSVEMPEADAGQLPSFVEVLEKDAPSTAAQTARVRHITPLPTRPGLVSVGLHVTGGSRSIDVEDGKEALAPSSGISRLVESWRFISAAVRLAAPLSRRDPRTTSTPRVIDITNERGEVIRAIIDSWGATVGAPAIVIPPAWGRTKETLLPLALTIVETYRRAGQPVVVVRFDGVRKRGESTNETRVAGSGDEHLGFTFSQGVRDIDAVLRFLETSPETQTRRSVLVTFSASSIEGRRAVRVAQGRSLAGWVCVVGSADLQSMMRGISGGIDFVAGIERGMTFGLQEILGVVVDIDHAGRDAIEAGLAYLEDACADFEKIELPVTWFHGAFDAWMDLERVRHALSFGNPKRRRIVEIPTGHQLRTSREALRVFGLIAEETAAMLLGSKLQAASPDLVRLQERQRTERSRLPKRKANQREFWQRYLLGRESGVGIELMTRTSPHRDLMAVQIARMKLRDGDRVADIGAGTGAFMLRLSETAGVPAGVTVEALDLVIPALQRARQQIRGTRGITGHFVACDLGSSEHSRTLPLRAESCDAVLASLVLSYVPRPDRLLVEIARILRPGGRLVVSCLKPDADVSRIFFKGLSELRSGKATLGLGRDGSVDIDLAARGFLNDAARLIDLEEAGEFEFWEAGGLSKLVRSAGFRSISVETAFGDPPQALIAAAVKPATT